MSDADVLYVFHDPDQALPPTPDRYPLSDALPDPLAEGRFADVTAGDPLMTRSVPSGSPGGGTQARPFRSMKSTVAKKAQRLLPSGSGWFLTR